MDQHYLPTHFARASRKRRIAAFLIDHFMITFLLVALVFLVMGSGNFEESNPGVVVGRMLLVMLPGMLLYFAKDSIRGTSFGKWILGIRVRDEADPEQVPSLPRLFLRNLLVIIWPVEFIIMAVNDDKKRLGDRLAKTVVLRSGKEDQVLPRVLAVLAAGLALFAFLIIMVGAIMKNSAAYKVATTAIESNLEIIAETGGITGYGMMPMGSINITNGEGEAEFDIKVLGKKQDLEVRVSLQKQPREPWTLVDLRY